MEPITLTLLLVSLLASGWVFLRSVERHCVKRIRQGVLERSRAAREHHDTLLQNFQGVLLKFHAATVLLPQRPSVARVKLEEALARADQTIAEGRDALQELFASTSGLNGLGDDLMRLAAELGADPADEDAPSFHSDVQGEPRDLQPIVRDEVHRIAREAVRNAFRHARADHIEVGIHWGVRRFELRVADDGRGIDAAVLSRGLVHSGIGRMREHARLAGGKLTIRSDPRSGTEIRLVIPARHAYVE